MTDDVDMDAMLERCFKILKVKGDDYTVGNASVDRLHNFRTVASFTGLKMGAVWSVYFYKHVSAIFAFVRGGTESEPIEERIADAINYLLLFAKMVAESKRQSESKS